jgi:hypothetical protein
MNKVHNCSLYFDSLEKKEHFLNIMRGLKTHTGLSFGEIAYRAVSDINFKEIKKIKKMEFPEGGYGDEPADVMPDDVRAKFNQFIKDQKTFLKSLKED